MSATALLEPPPTAVTAAPALTDLVLLRLLPATKSVGAADLRKDLGVFFRREPQTEEVTQAIAALKAEGLMAAVRGNRISDAGRARALQKLRIDTLPSRASWGTIKAKYLVPRALGIAPDAAEYAKANDANKFAAFLLKRELDLPNAGNTVAAVVDALLCRELGHPDFTSLNALVRATLGKALGGSPIGKSDATAVLPKVTLKVKNTRKDQLIAAVLGGHLKPSRATAESELSPEPRLPQPEEPFDLEMFANTVKAVARTCPTGRFGDNKVFISHVWAHLQNETQFRPLGLDGFKTKLVEANRDRLMTLSRADLVQLMDPADVRASEIAYLTATFHFILIEGN